MKKQTDKKNLGFLGEPFQYKLVHEFTEDHELFKDLSSVVDQNMFTDPNLKTYVGVMKGYYEKYDCVPSYDTMLTLMNEKSHSDTEREFIAALIEKIKKTPSDGAEYTRELAAKFFIQQNIIKCANEILRIAGDGDITHYDRCHELLTNALNAGTRDEMGSGVFDDLSETLSEDYRITIPTGIGKIDETLEGGIGKGELGAIIGPSSFGKTSMTTAMGSYAAENGFKVLQIVFEDRIKQIQRKHIARLVNVESKDLSKPQNKDAVYEQIRVYKETSKCYENIKQNLRILRLPSGEKTAWDIERIIKKFINNGFRPDLVIIDYFECLAHRSDQDSSNEWEKEGKTMRKFESMAGELNIAVWIPLQGTKESVNAELITMDKAGGSFKKIQIAHIVMSIARSNMDIAENKATIAILKNRAGGAGKVFENVEFNNGTCRISTDNVDELDGITKFDEKKQKEEFMSQKEIMKKIIACQKNDKK